MQCIVGNEEFGGGVELQRRQGFHDVDPSEVIERHNFEKINK